MPSDSARSVCVEAKIAGEKILIGIVIELAAAVARLQAQQAKFWMAQPKLRCRHVARHLGNPVADQLRLLRIFCNRGVGILVAADQRDPTRRLRRKIERDAPALDLAKIFTLEES